MYFHSLTASFFLQNVANEHFTIFDRLARADQFGGETGEKKLTRKRFKEVLLSIQHLSLTEQGLQLDKFITDYRKEVKQIDDILVIGVRV